MKYAVHTIEQDSLCTSLCRSIFTEKNSFEEAFLATHGTLPTKIIALSAWSILKKNRLKMCWLKEGAGNEKKISSDYFDQISFIQTYMSTTDYVVHHSKLVLLFNTHRHIVNIPKALCSQQNIVIRSNCQNLWIIW